MAAFPSKDQGETSVWFLISRTIQSSLSPTHAASGFSRQVGLEKLGDFITNKQTVFRDYGDGYVSELREGTILPLMNTFRRLRAKQ